MGIFNPLRNRTNDDRAHTPRPLLHTDYNDDPETGMIYFDLPDENEPEELLTSPRYQAGPPIVHQFWQLLFSIFMLDWLRQNEAGKRRIRNTT